MTSVSAEFHQLLDAVPDAMVVIDQHGRVAALNMEAERFFGWPEDEVVGHPLTRLVPDRFQHMLDVERDAHRASVAFAPLGASVSCFARRRDGSEFPVELSRRILGQGPAAGAVVTLRDRPNTGRAEVASSRHGEHARTTLESIGDSLITTDINCRVTYLNRVAERLTGWSIEEARGRPLEVVLPLIAATTGEPIANTATRCIEEGRSVDLEEGVLVRRRDGTTVPVGDSAAPIRNRLDEVIGVVLVIQDESEKRRVGRHPSFEAGHDALTGLANRREFERRLGRALADLAVVPAEHVLLCLDVDQFEVVNDSCGSGGGDILLQSLGALVGGHLRKRDILARLDGNEFGALLENCPPAAGERIAESIRAGIEHFRFEYAGSVFPLSASIGLLAVTADNDGVAAVLGAGDAACYRAKGAGGNRVRLEWLSGDKAAMALGHTGGAARLSRMAGEHHS